jgi:hypothetical protein
LRRPVLGYEADDRLVIDAVPGTEPEALPACLLKNRYQRVG